MYTSVDSITIFRGLYLKFWHWLRRKCFMQVENMCVYMVWKVRTCRSYANYGEYKLKRLQFNTKDPRLGSCNKFVRCFHNSEFVPSLEKNLFFSGNCVCMMLSVDSVPSVSMDNALRVHATHSWSGSTSTNTNTKTFTSS